MSQNAAAPLSRQSRQVSFLRLLLVLLALGVLIFTIEVRQVELAPESVIWSRWLLLGVGICSGLLSILIRWTRHQWQLALHLVFDLVWIGLLLHLTGGVASPALPLLFAVVLIANLVLPGVLPFVMPSLAALVLAITAALYLAHSSPFPQALLDAYPGLIDTHRILGYLAVQVGALFVVDLLAQLLTRRLREQRLFTDELLDQLGEGVIAIDQDGAIAYINDEARRLLALPQATRGQVAKDALREERVAAVRVLAQTGQLPQLTRMQGINGRHLVLRATLLVDRSQRPLGRTLLIADETRLRLLEENSNRSEHLASLGEMAAGIAHEIRNPLTSLRGCAQELADICAKADHADAIALAQILVGESDRLARIVSDFLALSRLRDARREPVDLEPLLLEAERMCRLRSDLPTGIELRVDLDDETPSVLGDSDQLKQIILNLLTNSLDAVRGTPNPYVHCHAERAADDNPLGMPAVVLHVIDHGCGIPHDLQARVFTPFFSTKAQGTGLGLSLVNRIVREHEGLLALSSELGVGTTITIHLPAHSQTRSFRRALGTGD